MFWRSKPKPQQKQESLISFLDKCKREESKPDPEKNLSEALSEYQTQYYEKVSNALDKDAEEAKKVVEQAKDFIGTSRVGYSLTRALLEYVRYWPAWAKREDCQKFANGPFRYVSGSRDESGKPQTTIVTFTYNSNPYTLRLVDEGMYTFTSDASLHGQVELRAGEALVIGLDISKDLSKGDIAYWSFFNVYAFVPGPWMKDLVEMAAYIDGSRSKQWAETTNRDALERARNIKLS